MTTPRTNSIGETISAHDSLEDLPHMGEISAPAGTGVGGEQASAGYCDAGDRCSCMPGSASRAACSLWKTEDTPTKVWGLIALEASQKPLIDKHCFGDCGKLSMAGAINDAQLGPLWVCCEPICPWLKAETAEPYGNTMSFGKPHEVFLRAITDTPATTKNSEATP